MLHFLSGRQSMQQPNQGNYIQQPMDNSQYDFLNVDARSDDDGALSVELSTSLEFGRRLCKLYLI